jgi:hypothetical protein
MIPKLTAERLQRGAMVYIRQSTPGQVLHHQESQRRQYALQDHARQLGFQRVAVIDEDLGRSGSGLVERSGFQQLVGAVCAGGVGAVFCIEASRLARNGREWHHLIELCGMTGTVIVDPDGSYDPTLMNDRLPLGLKGTMSEFELNRIEKDPDLRVQEALALVFSKMTALGSVRQVSLWFRCEGLCLPRRGADPPGSTRWAPPLYSAILVEEVVDVDEEKQEVVLLIHWGRHSELRVSQRGTGQHGRATDVEAIQVIRQVCRRFGDGWVAATLNRRFRCLSSRRPGDRGFRGGARRGKASVGGLAPRRA